MVRADLPRRQPILLVHRARISGSLRESSLRRRSTSQAAVVWRFENTSCDHRFSVQE